tara:strand:+ start:13094 stop:15901 length:2808 start_codon:yes stop_codon:yes gene_type:complete
MASGGCDPKVVKKGEEVIKKWFKKGGVINQNLGDKSFPYLKQLWWSTLRKDFDYGETPTLKELKVLDMRIDKVAKGFTKKTGKLAEMFYLPEAVLQGNLPAKNTFKSFIRSHNFFQGQRDEYQSVINSIVKKLGDKSRLIGEGQKGGFKNINKAHKSLSKKYNKYTEIMNNEGWKKAEVYYQKELADLSYDTQFKVFELANDVLRNPDLVKTNVEKYGIFSDIASEWKSISPKLFKDLRNGLDSYVKAISQANEVSGGAYTQSLEAIQKIRSNLKKQPNYFPTEVLEMFPTFKVLQESIYEKASPGKAKNVSKLNDYVTNMSEILIDNLSLDKNALERKYKDRVRYNKDIITVMDNYVRNVTMFNFASKSSNDLISGIREIQQMSPKNAEHQAEFYIDYLYDTHATMMGLNVKSPFWRTAARNVTAWEFASKLGLNLRGAVRNATQSLQNYVYFGAKGMKDSLNYLDTANIGALAQTEAKRHGVYFANARELTNTLGLFPDVVTSKINGKEVFTYKYDTVSRKFTEGLEKFAATTAKPMRWVENKVNRQLTFKIAFALRHQQLNNNAGMIEKDVRKAIKSGKLDEKTDVNEYVQNLITRRASNFGASMVKELHYEYSGFAKPKALRTPAGSILGQFMTYSFNFFNYQAKIASKAKDRIVAGDWRSEEAFRMYRLGMLYSFIYGVISPLTNTDVGNLVQNDTYERLKNYADAMSEDPEERKRAFYGKGPIIGTVGGPFVSDVITLGNVTGLTDLMSNGENDEHSWLGYLGGYQDYSESRDSDRVFDAVRTLNTEVARQIFVIAPRMYNGAGLGTLAQIEFGITPSKKMKERKAIIAEKTGLPTPTYAKVKPKKSKVKKKKDLVMEALSNLSKDGTKIKGAETVGSNEWITNIVKNQKVYSQDLQPLKGSLSIYNTRLLAAAKREGYDGEFDMGTWL